MARTQFSAQVFDKKNSRIMLQVKRRIIRAYDALCKEAGIVGAATSFNDPNKLFKLSDYPNAQKKIEKLLEGLAGEIESIVTDGVDSAWNLSNQKNSAMVKSLAQQFGWSEDRVNELSRRSLSALQAFKARTDAGMDLSQRVWDFIKHDRQKLEWALGLGLAEGKSAAALSRDVRQYLNEPNKLFRRVRDKHGNLVLSQAAKAYHPGQGVYRSSYKNALRLAVTETNMAYRTADHTAWSQMPFVVGIEVKLSAVHATSDIQGRKYPSHYFDMCDELAGVYPKDFKFTGWHPHCRCYVITKLASRQEMDEYSQLTDEQQKNYHFKDEVREAPKQYNEWIQKNELRIANAKSTPYFIRENPHYTDAALHPEKYAVKSLVLQYDVVDKLEEFRMYSFSHPGSLKFKNALDKALQAKLSGNQKEFDKAMNEMEFVKKTNERVAAYNQQKKAEKEAKELQELIEERRKIKKAFEDSGQYKEVLLDEKTGGVIAIHNTHNFATTSTSIPGMSGGDLEKEVAYQLFHDGHVVELCEEGKEYKIGKQVQTYAAIDMRLDGKLMDIASITKKGSLYGGRLNEKNQQAIKYSRRPDTTEEPDSMILYFHDPESFNEADLVDKIIPYYRNYTKKDGTPIEKKIKYVYVKRNGIQEIDIYDTETGQLFERIAPKGRGPIKMDPPPSAKVDTSGQNTKQSVENNGVDGRNRRLLIRKRNKYAPESVQDFDEKIMSIKQNAAKYKLDLSEIKDAYNSKDIKRLKRSISEMEENIARHDYTFENARKRHEGRKKGDIDKIQKAWNIRRLKADDEYYHVEDIENWINWAGLKRKPLEELLIGKLKKDRWGIYDDLNDLYDKYRKQYDKAEKEADKNYWKLYPLKSKFATGHGKKGKVISEKIEKMLDDRGDQWVARFRSKDMKDTIAEYNRQLAEIEANREKARKFAEQRSGKLKPVVDKAERLNVKYLEAKKYDKDVTDDEIISSLGGGDCTKGSCSSLALAFAGNKGGYRVMDFRGGNSMEMFSSRSTISSVCKAVGGISESNYDSMTSVKNLLGNVEEGKYYYFCFARHAAVIKKEGGTFYYLELQSAWDNGFHKVYGDWTLKDRFGHEDSDHFLEAYLIDIDKLNGDAAFKKLLGYINTEEAKQMKGKSGTIK